MSLSSPAVRDDQKEKPNFLVKVNELQAQLSRIIHAKGLLHPDVRDLFCKICSAYETLLLSDLALKDLQDVEYSLWKKLHYCMHIDEFRKKIKGSSRNSENTESALQQNGVGDIYMQGFQMFLQEAADFYRGLSEKLRKRYGIPEEPSYKWENLSPSDNLRKFRFLYHRFLICLGDLARYKEQYGNLGDRNPNWSVAVSYYLDAKMMWSDSGDTHNQLAVLARCVGDEFLALYHCVRSLAVKEPFPDAWDNLVLLFESNRSCDLHLAASDAKFDFLRPSERSSCMLIQDSSDFPQANGEQANNCSGTKLWPLIIRTLGFFFLKSSLEDFPCVFGNTMKELDMVMELDDIMLRTMLESYQLMDSGRRGPFRAAQVVSLFIFLLHDLMTKAAANGSVDVKNTWNHETMQLAWTVLLILMGRFVERCKKARLLNSCPLLPAVLIFVEWLAEFIDGVEACGFDGRMRAAMSYFFAVFADLLEHLKEKNKVAVLSSESTALWEDYELRGFAPVAQMHVPLNFAASFEHMGSYDSGRESRICRIIIAAMKIVNKSNGSCKWITCDKLIEVFSFSEGKQQSAKASPTDCIAKEAACEIQVHGEEADTHAFDSKCIATDEEEVILFKPLTRHNSAPVGTYIKEINATSSKDMMDQTVPSDECLRRATSVLIAQNRVQGNHSDFHSDISNFRRSQPFNRQDLFSKDTTSASLSEAPFSSGPPSLNAWVLNVNGDREQGRSNSRRQSLSTIDEVDSEFLKSLSMSEAEGFSSSSCSATNDNPPSYSAPMPSAPLLPADANWISCGPSGVSNLEKENSGGLSKMENVYDAVRVSSYPNWAVNSQPDYGTCAPGFLNKYTPRGGGLTSSEWLRQYRESRNLEQMNAPTYHLAAANTQNIPHHGALQLGLFDRYGVPSGPNSWLYGQTPPLFFHGGSDVGYRGDEARADNVYSRQSLYNEWGGRSEVGDEAQPLVEYLKEKEWLLELDPRQRNPGFMGNLSIDRKRFTHGNC